VPGQLRSRAGPQCRLADLNQRPSRRGCKRRFRGYGPWSRAKNPAPNAGHSAQGRADARAQPALRMSKRLAILLVTGSSAKSPAGPDVNGQFYFYGHRNGSQRQLAEGDDLVQVLISVVNISSARKHANIQHTHFGNAGRFPEFKVREEQVESGARGHEGRGDVAGWRSRFWGSAPRRCCLAITVAAGL
jgi:hypothetical protein